MIINNNPRFKKSNKQNEVFFTMQSRIVIMKLACLFFVCLFVFCCMVWWFFFMAKHTLLQHAAVGLPRCSGFHSPHQGDRSRCRGVGGTWKMDGWKMTRWWFHFLKNLYPYSGKWSNLTNSFQMGWFNHQLVYSHDFCQVSFWECHRNDLWTNLFYKSYILITNMSYV